MAVKTGDTITITERTYEHGDIKGISYLQTKVLCYTQDGALLWNADVSAYQAQAVVAPLYLWLILIGIGFFTGLLFNYIIGGASKPTPVEGVEQEK